MASIDNLVIFLYLAALIVIGLYANFKQNNVDDYYVAGRRQGSFSIACLWLAGWIGGASIIGSSGKAYEAGITGIWHVGALAALLAWKLQDVLDILLLAFTLNSAALILPTIAAVYAWRIDSTTAFWSICLSLGTVLGWYLAAAFKLAPVFAVEPLWPGLAVAFVSFIALRALRPGPVPAVDVST